MKQASRGFTLLETILATGILITASVAVASLYLSSIRTNMNGRDRALAIVLLSDKLEQFTTMSLSALEWMPGRYTQIGSTAADGSPLILSWEVSSTRPKQVTVAVTRGSTELIRATATVAAKW